MRSIWSEPFRTSTRKWSNAKKSGLAAGLRKRRCELPRRQGRPRCRRHLCRPSVRARKAGAEECAAVRPRNWIVRPRRRAGRRTRRRYRCPPAAEPGDRPAGDDRCAECSRPVAARDFARARAGRVADPTVPAMAGTPIDQRRTALAAAATRMFGKLDKPVIRVAIPASPGAKIVLSRLASDWGALGLTVEAASPGQPADFRLIDAVAPSTSPAWYLRNFPLRRDCRLRSEGRRIARWRTRGDGRGAA